MSSTALLDSAPKASHDEANLEILCRCNDQQRWISGKGMEGHICENTGSAQGSHYSPPSGWNSGQGNDAPAPDTKFRIGSHVQNLMLANDTTQDLESLHTASEWGGGLINGMPTNNNKVSWGHRRPDNGYALMEYQDRVRYG